MSDKQASALPTLDGPGDAELISAVRAGDLDAYGELFARHVEAARRLARQLVSAGDVDDLVSESFAKVLSVLQKGGGPDLAFRAYLLTSLRRLHVDRIRAGARLRTTDDLTAYDPGVPFEDTAVSGFENAAAAKAFSSLPERWQQVLWHTEVEGQKPADIALLLGMSANSVSALAYRAREGLRQAFITMHAQDAVEDACTTTRANLGAYIRNGISRRDAAKVEAHLQECRPCAAIYLELVEVNSDLGALLAPMVLGSAGAGYLAVSHAAAVAGAKGGLVLLLDRGKDWATGNPVASVGAGVAAATVVAVGVAFGVTAHHHATAPVAASTPASAPSSTPAAPPAPGPSTAPGGSRSGPPSKRAATRPSTRAATVPARRATAPLVASTPPLPGTPPVSIPPTVSPPTLAPPVTVPTPNTTPVITTQLPLQHATPGTPLTIDLTRGASSPVGRPLHVVSATADHGTVRTGSGPTTAGARSGAAGDAAAARTDTGAVGGGGTIAYTPDPGWRGVDTIHYVLADSRGGQVSGAVEVSTPNAAPTAVDHGSSTRWNGLTSTCRPTLVPCVLKTEATVDLLRGVTDPNHDPVGVVGLGPDHLTTLTTRYGTVTLGPDGTATYSAVATFGGAVRTDRFTYTVSDRPPHGYRALTSTASVTVRVEPIGNLAPVAMDKSYRTSRDTPLRIDLTRLSYDPDGDPLTYTYTRPAHGTLQEVSPGVLTYVYAPIEDTVGIGLGPMDSFRYTVDDGHGNTASATIWIHLRPNGVGLR